MNQMKNLCVALATLTFGALSPGCVPAPDATLGSFCASPAEGGEYCVSANQSPAGAWNTAALHGGLPIQLWAKLPTGVTIDDLVLSREMLEAWFTDIDRCLVYLRDENRNAESYKASMEGNLGTLLQQARDRQIELRGQKPIDPIGRFKRVISNKASDETSPLSATIAADKQSMMPVQDIFDRAKGKAAPRKAAYATIAAQFSAYRATEAAETEAYVKLAKDASAASLDALLGVEKAIVSASKDASSKPKELTTGAMQLSADLQTFELEYQKALTPHTDFLATHGAARPDMTSSALRSLNAMLGYIQKRVTRSDATATSLLHGTAMRRQALVLLNAPKSVLRTEGR